MPDGKTSCWRSVPRGMKGFCGRKNTLDDAGVSMRPVAELHKPGRKGAVKGATGHMSCRIQLRHRSSRGQGSYSGMGSASAS